MRDAVASSSGVRIGLTAGCPAGVGPELLVRSLVEIGDPASVRWVFFGPPEALVLGGQRAGLAVQILGTGVRLGDAGRTCTVECRAEDIALPARWSADVSPEALDFQRDALVAACRAGARGELDGIFTGPIRKKALVHVEGGPFPGQTELCHFFLARDERPPLMCFVGGPFVLALATVHLPLREVADALSAEGLRHAMELLAAAAGAVRGHAPADGQAAPTRLAVLGLNPHAGEGGLLGREEIELVQPAMRAAQRADLEWMGPLPADGFFAQLHRIKPADMPHGVLAMFHDQGLCGYKALCRGQGVNLTWGLKIPRTSPDHGTADACVGTGAADADSTLAALRLAMQLAGAKEAAGQRS